jgi:hypothetical protein
MAILGGSGSSRVVVISISRVDNLLKEREKEEKTGCLRGAIAPLLKKSSPSPFKERGIKGVRF